MTSSMGIGGISVATSADLSAALSEVQTKIDEHKKWTESCITDFVMKLRSSTERIDALERDQNADVESLKGDIKALRAGNVTNAAFRQQTAIFEKRFEHEKEEGEAKLEHLKIALEKDISNSIGSLRMKAESLNANCVTLHEKTRVHEETLIPAMKAEIEEQKAKRLCETQRLEAELENLKDLCEQKIAQTAAALRFYVTAQSTKLQEELAPLAALETLKEDVAQKDTEAKAKIKAHDDVFTNVKAEVSKQRGDLDAVTEKLTADIGQHTKSLKVQEITMTNLQNSVAGDVNSVRETLKHDRASLMTEVAEARAAAARQAVTNDAAIQAVAGEVGNIRQFRELLMDRLHIEQIVTTVRDWQGTHVPHMTSAVKDLEDKARRLQANQSKDHEVLVDLHKSTSAIRGHFKMFHAIAAGLDDKPHPNVPDQRLNLDQDRKSPDDSKLPPINTPRR